MGKAGMRYSETEALQGLGVEGQELKRLVRDGELTAYQGKKGLVFHPREIRLYGAFLAAERDLRGYLNPGALPAGKGEFYSLDQACRELRLKEEELKRLVSEGEIPAFREGDSMKLRVGDVMELEYELSGGGLGEAPRLPGKSLQEADPHLSRLRESLETARSELDRYRSSLGTREAPVNPAKSKAGK